MSFGVPVVSTYWRGIPSIVDDGVTGLLVPTQDSQALASAMSRLCQDPVLRLSMGEQARAKYLRRYTVERYIQHVESALRMVGSDRPTNIKRELEKSQKQNIMPEMPAEVD
jgi:glycosyltransferase involved in cell wall biosynthesis